MARTFASLAELQAALQRLESDEVLPAVLLTPELGQQILESNPLNRRIRPANLARLKREIESGFWEPRKSPPIRFLPKGMLADGQHRVRAVVETGKSIVVSMSVVADTIGVDEGANRTLTDHLRLSTGMSETDANIASVVTKALCKTFAAGNREYLAYFEANHVFITECVRLPQSWLVDQLAVLSRLFPPRMIAVIRARAIREYNEAPAQVDELLSDAINQGKTAPEGSDRRKLSEQLFSAMEAAYRQKKVPARDVMKWVIAALKFEREGIVRNILTARTAKKVKTKKAA